MRKIIFTCVVVLVVALPVGFAVGQQLSDDSPGVPASECPEAAKALEELGEPAPDNFIPGCPSDEELADLLDAPELPPGTLSDCRDFLDRNPDAGPGHICAQLVEGAEQ
ncbi:MAG: hypothetical protein IT336_00420 [Thermomicrobiales bacterium]|nr:hypothetical protein [Thermomicrobiales bacterium]